MGKIVGIMIVYKMTWRWYGYIYVFIEWHVLWVKVKVSCFGWLASLTWCIYDYGYVMSWIKMLKLLVLNVWMTCDLKWYKESLLYEKLWFSGKVKIVEVVSRNGILQSKEMVELRLIRWNDIILIHRKVIISFLSQLWGSPSGHSLEG